MKRLLSINNYHYRRGGAEVVYLEHAAMFAAMGWLPAYFAMQHPKNLPTDWSRFFVEEIELGGDYSGAEKIRKGLKATYNVEARTRLAQLLDEFRPSVAQLHNVYHHLSPAILPVLRKRGVPVVLTAHDLKIACPNYRMLSGNRICEKCRGGNLLHPVLERCVHGSVAASALVSVEAILHTQVLHSYRRYVDRIVVPSRFFVSKFVEWGWDPARFTHVPNYVETDGIVPDYAPGAYFLYFGRLSAEKGLGTLARAALRSAVPLKIAGTGPMTAELTALAGRSGGVIELVGFQTGQALHDLIRGARAVVLPSEWYENAPLSALESMAMGKPVIGAQIGGISEMVVPDVSGWLFASGDEQALADRLQAVAALPSAEVAALGRQARQFVETTFSKELYRSAFVKLYSELA